MSLLVQYDHELQMRLGITSQTYVSKDDRIYYAGIQKKKNQSFTKKGSYEWSNKNNSQNISLLHLF